MFFKDYEGKDLGFRGEVAVGLAGYFDMGTRN